MPFYLDEVDVAPEVSGCESVLIVPCRFCPAASLAVRKKQPYLQPFRRLLKTAPYESLIEKMKESLERRGIRASVLRSRLLHQFVLCMWTSRRRRALRQRAKDYDVGFQRLFPGRFQKHLPGSGRVTGVVYRDPPAWASELPQSFPPW